MIRQQDKELIQELETLGEIIEWLESRNPDSENTPRSSIIDQKELKEWLRKPTVEQARSWLKKKASAPDKRA